MDAKFDRLPLDGALETVTSDDVLDQSPLLALLLPDVDFGDLITELTVVANDAIADTEQVIDSTTELVLNALETLNVEVDTVNISDFVEDLINFIDDLPDDATVADVLDEIDVPFLSDEELLDLLTDVSELISDVAPDLTQFSIAPFLDQGLAFVDDLTEGTGLVTIDGSSLSGELSLGGSTRTFTTDLSDDIDALLGDASEFLSGITGSASLSDGQFIGDVTIDDSQYELSLDITETLTDSLTSLFSVAEVTLPFTNGAFAVDIETALGDIDGMIDFADGDLDLDLTTPWGAVDTSIAFPEDAQFSVPLALGGLSPMELDLDLAAGVLVVPMFGGLEVALDVFSGELALADGVATLTLENVLPTPIETTFDIGPLASQVAIALTEDLSGELTLDAGVLDGTIVSSLGSFDLRASVDDLVLEASGVIDQTTGALALNDGVALINLETPLGELSAGLQLTPV